MHLLRICIVSVERCVCFQLKLTFKRPLQSYINTHNNVNIMFTRLILLPLSIAQQYALYTIYTYNICLI